MPPRRPAHTTDALYAVGRNVVNFQRLEHILKQLALFAPICATPARIQSEIEKRRARAERLTLGRAVKKWVESEFHTTEPKEVPRPTMQVPAGVTSQKEQNIGVPARLTYRKISSIRYVSLRALAQPASTKTSRISISTLRHSSLSCRT